MIDYDGVKTFMDSNKDLETDLFIKKVKESDKNKDTKLVLILCYMLGHAFYSLVVRYCQEHSGYDKVKNYDDLRIKMGNNVSFLFFRYFFLFYTSIKYVFYNYEYDNLKNVFEIFLRFGRKFKLDSNKYKLFDEIVNKFMDNYDFLYKTFFVNENIYFHVYFNNLIKYFLPLPYKVIQYSPVITFRNGVDKFYKKNDIDYLEKVKDVDLIKTIRYVKKKNIDKIRSEMDIHIPIKYLNPQIFKGDYIYLLAIKSKVGYDLLIVKNITKVGKMFKIKKTDIMYKRGYKEYNKEHVEAGLSFETISSEWVTVNSHNQDDQYDQMDQTDQMDQMDQMHEINSEDSTNNISYSSNKDVSDEVDEKIVMDNIVYISVMKKMEADDFYNVFTKMDFKMDDYNYLFHYTGLDIEFNTLKKLLNFPTFFALTPYIVDKRWYEGRKCLVYKINKDIDNVLDITQSTVSRNPFNLGIEKEEDARNNKSDKWVNYDFSKIMNYYDNNKDNKIIPKRFHENNRCITLTGKNINEFIKERPYCDINTKLHYSGRRRLQEIVYKTRKYDASRIWIYDHHFPLYKKYGFNDSELIRKKIYGFVYDKSIYDTLYHTPMKQKSKLYIYNYDTAIIRDLGINGFFFTDYIERIETGGELLLSQPTDYITMEQYADKECYKKDIKFKKFSKS